VQLIQPGEDGYDRLRAVFDHRVERRPAAIACCATASDVEAALAYASERGLPYAVRSGAASARATIDDGVVIDVSQIKGVAIEDGVARVGSGVTWAELDAATQAHGLAVTGGRVSWMGVAGVALGEGSGWLERALGATGDSVISVEETELVATSLTLRLAPAGPQLLCGFLTFPSARAREVAGAYRELMASSPPEVGGALTVYPGRAGGCQVAFCFLGDVAEGERWVAPLRALRPRLDAVAPNPYVAFQAMTDTQHPFGMRAERRLRALEVLGDDVLDAVLEAAARPAGSALSRVVLRPRGGVLGGAPWSCECLGLWPPVPSLDGANLAWVDRVDAALAGAAISA
jgi:hypothetical protein